MSGGLGPLTEGKCIVDFEVCGGSGGGGEVLVFGPCRRDLGAESVDQLPKSESRLPPAVVGGLGFVGLVEDSALAS